MILHQIFLILLECKKKIIQILVSLIIFFVFTLNSNSVEIKNLLSINKLVITNIDFADELRFNKILLKKNDFSKLEKDLIFESFIKEKIKELQIKEEKIKISNEKVQKRIEDILNQTKHLDKQNQNEINFIKKKLKEKIYTQSAWDELILRKFSSSLDVNLSEINEKVKTKKIDQNKLEFLIQREKQKKIVSNSETYFNEIKQRYFIKKFNE